MLNRLLFAVSVLIANNLFSSDIHWECVPNDDFIEYADCTSDNGKQVRVQTPDQLGDNFTLTAKFPSGSLFEGSSKNGKLFGKRTDPDGQIIKGILEGIYFEGEGTIIFPADNAEERYEGYISVDQPNGKGIIYYKESSEWEYAEGIFKNGEHISATYYQRDGSVVKGKIVDGQYQGYIEAEFNPEDQHVSYKGFSVNSKKHGFGRLTYKSGDIYEGYFIDDLRSGYGEYTFNIEYYDNPVFSKAKGMFVNDALNGLGELYGRDGSLFYSGELVNGLRQGHGTTFWEGGMWIGEHADDAATGNGRMLFENGEYYEGFVVQGEYQGPGKAYFPLVNETYIGNFDKGLLQGEGEFYNGIWRYNGNFKNGLFNGTGKITLADGESYFAEYKEGIYQGELDIIPNKSFTRVALVIGNNNYESSPLDNAVSDSIGVKVALESKGFEVIHETDLSQANFLGALEKFERALKKYGPSTEALFYYAGHAVQVDGINYLNPVDAKIETKYDLEVRSISVSRIFSILEKTVSGVKIVILDACRNNPFNSFVRSPQLGLAQMNAPSGMIISYSTAPGSVALDGTIDGYGFFTGSLVNSINTPGLTIEEVFKKTRQSVVSLTNRQQIPWESSSLLGDFYFLESEN